jgi:hypothetical protein
MSIRTFPRSVRERREHVLRVAASAAPLLEAAVAAGNATMIERIFEALGAFAHDADAALDRLDAVAIGDAKVVPIRSTRAGSRAIAPPAAARPNE